MLDFKEQVDAAIILHAYNQFFAKFAEMCRYENIDFEVKTEIVRSGMKDLMIKGDKSHIKVYYKED